MIVVLILKKARLSWFFFVWCLLAGLADKSFAQYTILSFLTNNVLLTEQTAAFNQFPISENSIARLRIHYLTSSDCQSGYVSFTDTSNEGPVFPIISGNPFVLDAEAVYQAGKDIAGYEHVEAIHSILIRFIGTHGQFARFTSSCNDESINCCVPVDCSNATETCLSQMPMETQNFTLSNIN